MADEEDKQMSLVIPEKDLDTFLTEIKNRCQVQQSIMNGTLDYVNRVAALFATKKRKLEEIKREQEEKEQSKRRKLEEEKNEFTKQMFSHMMSGFSQFAPQVIPPLAASLLPPAEPVSSAQVTPLEPPAQPPTQPPAEPVSSAQTIPPPAEPVSSAQTISPEPPAQTISPLTQPPALPIPPLAQPPARRVQVLAQPPTQPIQSPTQLVAQPPMPPLFVFVSTQVASATPTESKQVSSSSGAFQPRKNNLMPQAAAPPLTAPPLLWPARNQLAAVPATRSASMPTLSAHTNAPSLRSMVQETNFIVNIFRECAGFVGSDSKTIYFHNGDLSKAHIVLISEFDSTNWTVSIDYVRALTWFNARFARDREFKSFNVMRLSRGKNAGECETNAKKLFAIINSTHDIMSVGLTVCNFGYGMTSLHPVARDVYEKSLAAYAAANKKVWASRPLKTGTLVVADDDDTSTDTEASDIPFA